MARRGIAPPGLVRFERTADYGPPEPRAERFVVTQKSWQNAMRYFRDTTQFLLWKRNLGWGGFGISMQFEVRDQNGNYDRDVAIKWPREDGYRSQDIEDSFRDEIYWLSVFRESEHFIQLVGLPAPAFPPNTANNPLSGRPFIMMELIKGGSLQDLIYRIEENVSLNKDLPDDRRKLEYIPNRMLWRLFLCLTRACIGMAYPIKDQFRGSGRPWREVIPQGEAARRIIHFDIDPGNVFVGTRQTPDQYRDPIPFVQEHDTNPVVKMADYGLMHELAKPYLDRYEIPYVSKRGKKIYWAPEQFDTNRAGDWDQFGPHTNIWGIGCTMFNLITHFWIRNRNVEERRITIPSDGTGSNPVPQERDLWTYGHHMLDRGPAPHEWGLLRNSVDEDLRVTVARCMAHFPADRPSLQHLVDVIERNIRDGDAEAWRHDFATSIKRPRREDDFLLIRFYREYIHDPPEQVDVYAEYWNKTPYRPPPPPSNW